MLLYCGSKWLAAIRGAVGARTSIRIAREISRFREKMRANFTKNGNGVEQRRGIDWHCCCWKENDIWRTNKKKLCGFR
jgi:hypothetical protein